MRFFEADDGSLYPVSEIERMRPGEPEAGGKLPLSMVAGRVYLKGSNFEDFGVKVQNGTIEAIQRSGGQCFAAPIPYTLLTYYAADEHHEQAIVGVTPVIGWQLDEWGRVGPLVFEPEWEGMKGNNALRHPSGNVVDIFGSWFKDQDEWECDQARLAEAQAKAKKVAAPE